MWAGLTPDSNGGPTSDIEEPVRRRQETPYLSARRKRALPASPGGPPSTGRKKLRVLNPILGLYQIQPTGRCSEVRVKMCLEWSFSPAAGVNCVIRCNHLRPIALASRAQLSHDAAGSGRALPGLDASTPPRAARSCHRRLQKFGVFLIPFGGSRAPPRIFPILRTVLVVKLVQCRYPR